MAGSNTFFEVFTFGRLHFRKLRMSIEANFNEYLHITQLQRYGIGRRTIILFDFHF